MKPTEDNEYSGLLDEKLKAVRELLTIAKQWDEQADYENTSVFTDNLDTRRKMLDKVVRIDRELDRITRQESTSPSGALHQDLEQIFKINEVLSQIQLIMDRDHGTGEEPDGLLFERNGQTETR